MKKLREIKEDFIEGLSDSFTKTKMKNIMTRSTAALLALSISSGAFACALPSHEHANHDHKIYTIQDAMNGTIQKAMEGEQSGIVVKNPEYLKEFTPENFKEVIDNGESGVYKHPFLEGEVATFMFDNDKSDDVYKDITIQLGKLGVDQEGFGSEYRGLKQWKAVSDAFLGGAHSSHLQFNHELYDDTNTSAIYVDSMKERDATSYMNLVTTMLHEAGHSLKDQQLSSWDRALNSFEPTIKAENSSFVIGHLSSYQFATKIGVVDGVDYKEVYLNNFETESMMAHQILEAKNSGDAHLYNPNSYVLTDMMKNQGYMVNELSNPELVKLAAVLSDKAIDYDFIDEYKEKKELEAIGLFTMVKSIEDYEKRDPSVAKNFKNAIEIAYDKIDLDKPLSKKMSDVVIQKKMFDYYEDGASDMIKEEFIEMYINDSIDDEIGKNSLKLSDKGSNHIIASLSMENYYSSFKDSKDYKEIIEPKLEKENLVKNTLAAENEMIDELKKETSQTNKKDRENKQIKSNKLKV